MFNFINRLIGLVGRLFANSLGDLGSIPLSLTLSNIRYVSRVKWRNPGKGVVPSLHLSVVAIEKGAFWPPSTMVANKLILWWSKDQNSNWERQTDWETEAKLKTPHHPHWPSSSCNCFFFFLYFLCSHIKISLTFHVLTLCAETPFFHFEESLNTDNIWWMLPWLF